MGYRSYGNLVFPAKFLPVFWETVYAPKFAKVMVKGSNKPQEFDLTVKNIKEVLQEWDNVVVWKDQEGVDMAGLSYSGWKWHSSFPDISRLHKFMMTLDGYLDSQDTSEMFSLTEDIPEGVVTKLKQDYQSINVFQFGKVAARWDWGWNRQGEDTEDYEQIGYSDTLWNAVEMNWGGFEPIVSGEAWVFGMEVNEIEKIRMQAILDQKFKIPFDGAEAVFRTFDGNVHFFLYGQDQRMPPVVDLKYWFASYLGTMEVNRKDENDEIVRAEAFEHRGSFVVEGDNYWDRDVYAESYPSFEYYGKELDLDEVLQSYMKVAKEE